MKTRVVAALALALVCCGVAAAQQQAQPVTFVTNYYVRPGKTADFMDLVRTVGAPIRDRMMAAGVIQSWGVAEPFLRAEGNATFSIWYSTADMGGVEMVQKEFAAALEKFAADDQKAAEEARKKGQKAPKSTAERIQETVDMSKTSDVIFRHLVVGGTTPLPAGSLPYYWLGYTKTLPGKGGEYRELWEKYNKPTYDKLASSGAIAGFGLATEEARTTDAFTHLTMVQLPDLAAREKVRAAFAATTASRSEEMRRQVAQAFLATFDPAASRTIILRSLIYKTAPPR